jgi:hypothetical protein
MSFWTEDEKAALDYVVIDTSQGKTPIKSKSPGVMPVPGGLTGDGIPRNWQVREGFGLAGSTQAFRGIGLCEFSTTHKLWTLEQRDQFEVYDSLIAPSPPGSPEKVYGINHPVLALRGITQCVFLSAPLVMPQADDSILVTYKCRQWRKPLPTVTSPTSAKGETDKGAAKDEYDKAVEQRTAEFRSLLQPPKANSIGAAFARFTGGGP